MIKLLRNRYKEKYKNKRTEITASFQGGYVLVQVPPNFELNSSTVTQLWKTMADACKNCSCNQVIVEGTIHRSMSPADVVQSAQQPLKQGLHGLRLAICWYDFEADDLSDLFITSAASRGTLARLCKNRTEAKEWLGVNLQSEGTNIM
jgi:hypothetical protein